MSIVVWVVQGLLALGLIAAGLLKISQPIEKLGERMTFVHSYSPAFVRFIGAAEVLGGLGLILPGVTGILTWLTPVAALGIAIIMIGAVYYHFSHNEQKQMPGAATFLLLAVVVIVGRLVVAPF